ncbi:MAG: alpha/beta hydrolase [Deltaproteobacteria bacterium]|nr:alpha/beta hydrolase [Deltaproteobacteria bacterium]
MPSYQFRLLRGFFRWAPARAWAYTPRPTVIDRLLGRTSAAEPFQPPEKRKKEDRMRFARLPAPKDATITSTTVGGVPALRLRHNSAKAGRAILYFHGGGYVYLSPLTHRGLGAALSKETGAEVVLLDYRMGPECPFPAAVEDAVAVWKALLAEGLKPDQAVFAGDSAGGGLTLAAMLELKQSGGPLPAGGVCLSPWTDLAMTGGSIASKAKADPMLTANDLSHFASCYLGGADPRNPLASPLYADLTGLPPLYIQVGSDEILLDDAIRLHEKAEKAGVRSELDVWDEMIHVWQVAVPLVPESREAVAKIGAWLSRLWGS